MFKRLFFVLFLTSSFVRADVQVVFRVLTPNLPPDSKVYISGNQPNLGEWHANVYDLRPETDSTWTRGFTFNTGTSLNYKFTRGSWMTEAVDSTGMEKPNFSFVVTGDTVVSHTVKYWRDQVKGKTLISAQRLANKGGWLELEKNWKYAPGDDSLWARPDYNDSDWVQVDPMLRPEQLEELDWPGIGWFRLHIDVDSSVYHQPYALVVRQAGASEVWLDGELLYELGRVSASEKNEIPLDDLNVKYIVFEPKSRQVLAIRYSNHAADIYKRHESAAGFSVMLRYLNDYSRERLTSTKNMTTYRMAFTCIPAAFAAVYFLLFVFYPRQKNFLYFSLLLIGFSVLSYTVFTLPEMSNRMARFTVSRILATSVAFSFAMGVLTIYSSVYEKIPKRFLFFVIVAGLFIIGVWMPFVNRISIPLNILSGLNMLVAVVESIRITLSSRARREDWPWLISVGFLLLILGFVFQLLIDMRVIPSPGGVRIVYVYGILSLGLCIAVYLSRNWARSRKDLERQLVQIKNLSEQNLQHERRVREEEITRRVLEADNARKTRELEEARRLQLSMLPRHLPQVPDVDIAVYMQPATEVGGDYYDFYQKNGALTIAIGDATGHGMKAGTMVASIKSLFRAFGGHMQIIDFFNKCTEIIRSMNLGNLYMAMMLVRLENSRLITSSAGMPPIFIYRHQTKTVNEFLQKGMPLGGPLDYPYTERSLDLQPGDAVLLMSDGFPELFNQKGEMLDYGRAKMIFQKTAEKNAQEIIRELQKATERWMQEQQQNDDITFVVLKVKNGPGGS